MMPIKDLLKKYDKTQTKAIDDIIYGKDEDLFVRNVRRKQMQEKYGNAHLTAWLPGRFAYLSIKDHLKDPDLTKKEKIALCTIDVGFELILDAIRVGGIYGLYKFNEYLN